MKYEGILCEVLSCRSALSTSVLFFIIDARGDTGKEFWCPGHDFLRWWQHDFTAPGVNRPVSRLPVGPVRKSLQFPSAGRMDMCAEVDPQAGLHVFLLHDSCSSSSRFLSSQSTCRAGKFLLQ